MCANLRHVVLVSVYFHTYQLISTISKKNYVISQLTVRILTNSPISIKFNQTFSHRIRICASLERDSNGVGFKPFSELNTVQLKQWLCHVLLSKIMWAMIPPKFSCPEVFQKLHRLWWQGILQCNIFFLKRGL